MSVPARMINRIRVLDPGFLALKRSIKTFIAIMISLIIFWNDPGMAMFAAISSMLFSRSQAGFTITERRFTILATGLVMVMISVPVTLAGQSNAGALIFVFLASFAVFFLIGNRVVPDFPAVTLLALAVVEMAFSHTLSSGLEFSGLFLITLALVYLLHFVIWPTRPMNRLKSQIEIIRSNLMDYQRHISGFYPDAESGMRITQEQSDKVRKSLGDFRRLWQLFGVHIPGKQSAESHYMVAYQNLRRIHEFLILMWQFRVNAWGSGLYKNKVLRNSGLAEILENLVSLNGIGPDDEMIQQLLLRIQEISKDFFEDLKQHYKKSEHAGWVASINTIKALEALANDLAANDMEHEPELRRFSVANKFKSFLSDLSKLKNNLNFSNAGLRLGIRSALIITLTLIYSRFYQPEYGYWLVLFAVLLIRPNLGISIKVGKERLLGTIAGSVTAFAFVLFVPEHHPLFFLFMLLSLFLMLWFINQNRMVPMVTALTFLIISLFYYMEPGDSDLVWLRILYTAAVVLLVVILSFVLWPEKARKRFAGTLADALELEKHYFENIFQSMKTGNENPLPAADRQKIRDRIQNLDEVIDATRNEVIQEKLIIHGINIRSFILRLLNTMQSLEVVSRQCLQHSCFKGMEPEFEMFSSGILHAFDSLILAFRQRQDVKNFPDVRAGFEELRIKFREIKYRQDDLSESMIRFWNSSAFIWNLKPLILELEGIKNEINEKMKTS